MIPTRLLWNTIANSSKHNVLKTVTTPVTVMSSNIIRPFHSSMSVGSAKGREKYHGGHQDHANSSSSFSRSHSILAVVFGGAATALALQNLSKGNDDSQMPIPWMSRVLAASSTGKKTPILERADKLYDDGQLEELIKLLAEAQAVSPNDAEITWRRARALRDSAQFVKDDAKKKALVLQAHDLAKHALQQDDNNFACHKWFAITLSDVGDFEGAKVKIGNAFIMKKHFDRAVELNPNDATSHHLVGVWCFTFADMPWYLRKIASALFASPPTSTYEEALAHFVNAERIDPGFYIKNTFMIGECHLRLNNVVLAKEWLMKAATMHVTKPADIQTRQQAEALLAKL